MFWIDQFQGYTQKKRLETVFVQVMDRPNRKAIVKRGVKAAHYFEYCEEVGCDVWDELAAINDALQEPLGMWLPEKMRLDTGRLAEYLLKICSLYRGTQWKHADYSSTYIGKIA